MPRSQLNQVLDAELGPDWSSKLITFDYEPMAAASIGQVMHGSYITECYFSVVFWFLFLSLSRCNQLKGYFKLQICNHSDRCIANMQLYVNIQNFLEMNIKNKSKLLKF